MENTKKDEMQKMRNTKRDQQIQNKRIRMATMQMRKLPNRQQKHTNKQLHEQNSRQNTRTMKKTTTTTDAMTDEREKEMLAFMLWLSTEEAER